MAKFVERAHWKLYLLPVDMRDWRTEDDLPHFVLEAVEWVPLVAITVNERGTDSAHYRLRMMLALLVRYLASNCAPSDGSAWRSGDCSRRVFRGGSWISTPEVPALGVPLLELHRGSSQ